MRTVYFILSRRSLLRTLPGAAVGLLAGCRKAGETSTARPTTKPVAPKSATAETPTGPLPTDSRLIVDGLPLTFGAARLVVQGTMPLSLAVFSEKAADAAGSYFFDMTFESVEDLSGLDGESWLLVTPEERTDDNLLTTIQLGGGAEQLQPQQITVQFAVEGRVVHATLSGRWGLFTATDAARPDRVVLVSGELVAELPAGGVPASPSKDQ